jgi:hypothetical protein
MIVAVYATRFIVHPSIRGGMMGNMLAVYLALPAMAVALVVWAAATRGLATGPRLAALVAIVVLTCGSFALIRTDGTLGASSQITWRWTPTAEERLLALAEADPVPPAPVPAPAATPEPPAVRAVDPAGASPSAPAPAKTPEGTSAVTAGERPSTPLPVAPAANLDVRWAGFRGPARDSVIHGVQIETDWAKSPPVVRRRRRCPLHTGAAGQRRGRGRIQRDDRRAGVAPPRRRSIL